MQVMVTLGRTASSQGWLHNLQGSAQNECAVRPGSGKSIFPFHGSAYSGPVNPKELQSPWSRYLDGVKKRPMSVTPNCHHNTSVVLSVGALGMGGNSCCLISPSQPPNTGAHTPYTCAQVTTRGRGWQQMQPLSSTSNPSNLVSI